MGFDGTLLEASYEGVTFPVAALQVNAGNASAKHVAYRRVGADIEPCGTEPYSGTLSVPCLDVDALNARYQQGSPCWPGLFLALDALFKATPIGRLVHPTLGEVTVHVDSWTHAADPSDRSGVVLQVAWTEHNASASLVLDTVTSATAPTDSSNAVQSKADACDAKASALAVPGWQTLSGTFSLSLAALAVPGIGYGAMTSAVRAMTTAVNAALALPGLDTVETAGLALDLELLRSQAYAIQDQMTGAGAQPPRLYTVPTEMAAWQVAAAVYGDASLDGLIVAANPITDPSAIPAGTVLTILPQS